MKFVINLLLSGLAVAVAAYVAPGVEVASFWIAIIVAVVFGLVNATVGSALRLVTLPLNFLSFGLISAIITILMVFLTEKIIPGFSTSGWISAIIFALLLGLINGVLGVDKKK